MHSPVGPPGKCIGSVPRAGEGDLLPGIVVVIFRDVPGALCHPEGAGFAACPGPGDLRRTAAVAGIRGIGDRKRKLCEGFDREAHRFGEGREACFLFHGGDKAMIAPLLHALSGDVPCHSLAVGIAVPADVLFLPHLRAVSLPENQPVSLRILGLHLQDSVHHPVRRLCISLLCGGHVHGKARCLLRLLQRIIPGPGIGKLRAVFLLIPSAPRGCFFCRCLCGDRSAFCAGSRRQCKGAAEDPSCHDILHGTFFLSWFVLLFPIQEAAPAPSTRNTDGRGEMLQGFQNLSKLFAFRRCRSYDAGGTDKRPSPVRFFCGPGKEEES